MLSAKKIKIHGMHSRRWTIKDKLTQYKGLINLYTRDRKILEFDTNVNRKKQFKMFKELQKDLKTYRNELDNAIRGDKQALRNVLQEHRELQLAYQDLHPSKVVDHIHQDNFNKRKELDRLKYTMKLRSQILIDLKLELAELQDRLKLEAMFGQIKEEQQAQIITGKVQDAILKKEAAIVVQNTYKNILDIMKRDAVYFDAVLDTLKQDAVAQGKCMFRCTELGQLATEYLDDRQDEFVSLEKKIKADMKIREKELDEIRENVETLAKNLRSLIRRESDVTLIKRTISMSPSMDFIQVDITELEEILNKLKTATLVSSFDLIFPCLEEQKYQSDRLVEYAKNMTDTRDIVLNKYKHAKKMYDTLFFTMADNTMDYRTTKKDLLEEIALEAEKKNEAIEKISKRGSLIVQIRKSLQKIQQVSKHVIDPNDKTKTLTIISKKSSPIHIEQVEENGVILLNQIYQRLLILLPQAPAQLPDRQMYEATMNYATLVHKCTRTVNPLQKPEYESLVEVQIDDSKVPTREFIKAKSKEIVKENTKSQLEEEIEMPRPKKKKWKF